MKILVFATDILPENNQATSGTAIRTHGLVNSMRELGYQVKVLVPETATNNRSCSFDTFNFENQEQLIQDYAPDAILCGHWPACGLRSKPKCPVILDLAGPHLLERHFQNAPDSQGATIGKLAAIALADYFIVSGSRQRLYFLSFLTRAGVSVPEKRIIEIPMALPDKTPSAKTSVSEDPVFLYSGVFLPWQNPTKSLEATLDAMDQVGKGKLRLVGGKHPNYALPTGVAESLFEKLEKHPRVSIEGLKPYNDFLETLTECDVALNLMEWNLERQLAIPVRAMNYLWAGVPLVTDDYSDVSTLVKKYDAGWSANENNCFDIVRDILVNPGQIVEKSKNCITLANECLAWSHAASKLKAVLEDDFSILTQETDIDHSRMEDPNTSLHNNLVEQTFISRINGLSEVRFCVATHAKELQGTISASICDCDSSSTVTEEQISIGSSDDNKWFSLRFKKLKSSAGKSFKLKLESDAPIFVWAENTARYPTKAIQDSNKSLCLKTISQR